MNHTPSSIEALLGGTFGLVLLIIGSIITLAWLFLPLLVLSRLKRIEQAITAAHRELAAKTSGVQQALAPRRQP